MGSGKVPEFGAIFMSNVQTRLECFKRKLFGLPYPFADFVKAVKAGMILFLFDYGEKNLYGVFEAISDGAMDIVPHAYRSSGKKFPAQIRFNVIWNCGPLPEVEFRDAIKENYYEEYKFHFGLSKEQVCFLLWLFESRKVRVRKPLIGKSKKLRSPSVDSAVLSPNKCASPIDSGASNFLAVPNSLKSESVALHNKTEQADVSSCSASLGLEDYIPLPSPESPEPLEDPVDNEPKVKGLYSDFVEKASVFSRLNLVTEVVEENEKSKTKAKGTDIFPHLESVSKATSQKKQTKLGADKSVHEVMETLLQRQTEWATNNREAKRTEPASGNRFLGKRSNVFSRLEFPSEATIEKEDLNAKLDESLIKINEIIQGKKKKRAFVENYVDELEVDMTKRVETIEDASQANVSIPWTSGRMEKHAKFLDYKCETAVKEWTETESNDSNNVSVGMCMSDESLDTKPRLRSSWSVNKPFDVQSLISEGCLSVQMPSERKVNCGSFEDPVKSDVNDNAPSPLPQKRTLSSVICYPIIVTEPLITHQTCQLSTSPSIKDSPEMAEESAIIFLEKKICCEQNEACHLSASPPSIKDSPEMAEESSIIFLEEDICCEQNEERWQLEEVDSSYHEYSIYPVLNEMVDSMKE